MLIVVLGIMGRNPIAGVAYQALHYLEGFRRLGHEIYYVEDTQEWPYNPDTDSNDCAYTIAYINRLMTWCGLADRWAFCDVSQQGRVYGLTELQMKKILKQAGAIVNLTGSTELRDEYLEVPVRVYLETDPGVPQIEVARGDLRTKNFLLAHTHHFTFGENIGTPQCTLPPTGFDYHPTRQPVVLDWWKPDSSMNDPRAVFRTIATWRQSNDIMWNDETYTWSKDRQFLKFIDLPTRCQRAFELALACDDLHAIACLRSRGWKVVDALPLTKNIRPYRDYIAGSRAEFTVAKEQNTRLRTGWFSDRSASFLAAGRPVVTQDTGFGTQLPTGEGLFAFNTLDEIVAAVEAIEADYDRHSRAARQIAEEYFKAETVLAKVIEDVGL